MSRSPVKPPIVRPPGIPARRSRPHDWAWLKEHFRALFRDELDPDAKVFADKDDDGEVIGVAGKTRAGGAYVKMSLEELRASLGDREDRFFSVEGGAQHYTLEGPPGSSSQFAMPESPPPAQYRTPELEGGNAWLLGNLGDSIFRKGI